MSKYYSHITNEDRLKIYDLLLKGEAIATIADEVGFHRSTLYRELERNSCHYGYRPDLAAQQSSLRRYGVNKLDKTPKLLNYIIDKLKTGWSPERIAGRLRFENNGCTLVCHETIYRYIYSFKGRKLGLYKFLIKKRRFRYPRIKRKRRNKKNSEKISIHQRNEEINARKDFGHWEGDLMLFRKTQTNLLTMRERKSRAIIAIKNSSRKAKTTANTLLKYMRQSMHKTITSITLDNGVEFAQYQDIGKKIGADIFFCDPYKSYQKGAIENANKDIRTFLPRKSNIDSINQNMIDKYSQILNNRPMKCLGYKTPEEVFMEAFNTKPILTLSRASY
jgi:IS30 family transposase